MRFLWNTIKGIDYLLIYLVYKTGLRGSIIRMPRWFRIFRVGLIVTAPAVVWITCYVAARLIVHRITAGALATIMLGGVYWLLVLGKRRLFHIPLYDAGSARQLRGRCVVFELYVGKKWTRRKRRQGRESMLTACRWLEKKARARGIELSFVNEPDCDLILPDFSRHTRGLDFSFLQTNERLVEMAEEITRVATGMVEERLQNIRGDFDNHLLVVHLDRSAFEFAIPARNRLMDQVELEICYCSFTSSPSVYAHEILHLFGARDLYYNRELARAAIQWLDDEEEQREFLQRGFDAFCAKFPEALMATTKEPLDALEISPLSAHAIGWSQPAPIRAGEAKKYEEAAMGTLDATIGLLEDRHRADGGQKRRQ